MRPYSQVRLFSFLDWMATRWELDLTRTHVAGSSMGGSGSPMLAIRYPDRIAWATAWVGVHIPAQTPHFLGSYEQVYGKQTWDVKFEDGSSVWDHFSDAWYLRQHPQQEVGLICFSNGKNDSGIGWPQAAEFYRALQETRRPHIFVWGQSGHGQRARLPISLADRVMPMDLRTDQSLPAFTHCSLDDEPGDGDPARGDAEGQVNLYLYWETDDIVDQVDRWELTVGLVEQAPSDQCTVDITPRRVQRFRPKPGSKVSWTNVSRRLRAECPDRGSDRRQARTHQTGKGPGRPGCQPDRCLAMKRTASRCLCFLCFLCVLCVSNCPALCPQHRWELKPSEAPSDRAERGQAP